MANALENGSDYKHRKAAHQSFALIYRADILFWWRGLIIISDGFTGLEDQLLMVSTEQLAQLFYLPPTHPPPLPRYNLKNYLFIVG